MKKISAIGLFLTCIPLICSGYIYDITRLAKKDSHDAEPIFVGLSDFHDKANQANVVQISALEQALGGITEKTKFIVEDLSSHNSQGRFACGHYFVNSRGGILGGLADTVKSKGFAVENIEYRYCRVTSLGPVLNNVREPLHKFASVASTTIQALYAEIHATIKEIEAYNDGPVLQKMYQSIIKDVRAQVVALQFESHNALSVADYLNARSTQATRMSLLKKLLTFDSSLLDAKLVHSVVTTKDTRNIVAIAGGSHIVRVAEMLQKIGYKKIPSNNVAYAKEHDLQRCLGSHIIDGAYCMKPKPIDAKKIVEAIK